MSSMEFNKIAGAVLTAGVIAMFAGFIADLLVSPGGIDEAIYSVPISGEGGAEGATAEGPALEPVMPLLASADPANGEKVAKACTACHSFDKGGANKVGPNLWNIVGAKHAHAEGFAYSDALEGMADKDWTYEELNAFLANPKAYAPGTKMGYAGLKKVGARADIIVWMRSLSDNPVALPSEDELAAAQAADAQEADTGIADTTEAGAEADAAKTEEAEAAAGATQEAAAPADTAFLALIAEADPTVGEKLARRCSACHSFDQGGDNKVGPNLYNIVGAPIGAVEGFGYSEAFQARNAAGETWDYTNLWGFLRNPKEWEPGTKMVYPGFKKDDQLAGMIAYLRQQSENPPPVE